MDSPPGIGVRLRFWACLALRSTAAIWESSARTSASEGAPAATAASPALCGVAAAAWCTEAGAGKLAASVGSATSLRLPVVPALATGSTAAPTTAAFVAALEPWWTPEPTVASPQALSARAPTRQQSSVDSLRLEPMLPRLAAASLWKCRYPDAMRDEATAVELRPHIRLLHGMRRPAN